MKRVAVLLLALATASGAQTQSKPSAGTVLPGQAREQQVTQPSQTPVYSRSTSQDALPVGTPMYMTLETALTTGRNLAGDRFTARISRPVSRDSQTYLPEGALVEGVVVRVSEPRRIMGKPSILLRPESVTLPSGERRPLHAVVVDTNLYPLGVVVDDEGAIHGVGRGSEDWKHTGVGAGGGAAIGAIAGGGVGALAGAAIGTAASTVHWLAKRRSAELPAGTEILVELSRPLEPAGVTAAQ